MEGNQGTSDGASNYNEAERREGLRGQGIAEKRPRAWRSAARISAARPWCESELLAQSLPCAACFIPIRKRPDVDTKKPARLPDLRFDLGGRSLVLDVRDKILGICKFCKCPELHRVARARRRDRNRRRRGGLGRRHRRQRRGRGDGGQVGRHERLDVDLPAAFLGDAQAMRSRERQVDHADREGTGRGR
jgi:hypothetical protein